MLHNVISEESIKLLVDNFYKKIRVDSLLSPIFAQVIADNEWQPHLDQMYSFWSSIMLRTKKYNGTPMQKHMDLPVFDIKLFDRWLELFYETAKEIHPEELATQYSIKSQIIAKSLKLAIYS